MERGPFLNRRRTHTTCSSPGLQGLLSRLFLFLLHLTLSFQYLETFQRANAGNTHLQNVLLRYSRLIDVRCEKEYWKYLLAKDLV